MFFFSARVHFSKSPKWFPSSTAISSAQLPGLPEICKKSLCESPAAGDRDLFIVGKNFMKGTRVIFSQPGNDGSFLWEKNAEIDLEYFQQVKQIRLFLTYRFIHFFIRLFFFHSVKKKKFPVLVFFCLTVVGNRHNRGFSNLN